MCIHPQQEAKKRVEHDEREEAEERGDGGGGKLRARRACSALIGATIALYRWDYSSPRCSLRNAVHFETRREGFFLR